MPVVLTSSPFKDQVQLESEGKRGVQTNSSHAELTKD